MMRKYAAEAIDQQLEANKAIKPGIQKHTHTHTHTHTYTRTMCIIIIYQYLTHTLNTHTIFLGDKFVSYKTPAHMPSGVSHNQVCVCVCVCMWKLYVCVLVITCVIIIVNVNEIVYVCTCMSDIH